ncbi:NAD(P)/FAD-dependent oxidoreductase [Paraburkholderia sp. BR10882]|uniref:NAD(P)/FAD-dependent oxidoreductase n=1 Tax=unclassified Paraburkholderia TaxID=2615204 RepID=UPI0034CF073A
MGAGIIGISTALQLQDRGRHVCVIDRRLPAAGASVGNAGLIERSSVIPYAFPRQFSRLLRYALNREPDVRYDLDALPGIAGWMFAYWMQSSSSNLRRAAEAMLPLIERCVEEHDKLIERSGIEKLVSTKGWIEIYRDSEKLRSACGEANELKCYKLSCDFLSKGDLLQLEPGISDSVVGGIRWNDPKTVRDPRAMLNAYTQLFQKGGGKVVRGDARSFRRDGSNWAVESDVGQLTAKDFVIALGADSDVIGRSLGYKVPLATKRGYHLHFDPTSLGMPNHPLCDSAGGFVLAPMTAGIRLTTGIEFSRPGTPPGLIQIRRAEALARKVFSLGGHVEDAPWMGRRPCLPDMRPVIGPAPNHPGVWFNFGHAHHGLTLGPVSGRLLAEQMTDSKTFTNPSPFSVQRFS